MTPDDDIVSIRVTAGVVSFTLTVIVCGLLPDHRLFARLHCAQCTSPVGTSCAAVEEVGAERTSDSSQDRGTWQKGTACCTYLASRAVQRLDALYGGSRLCS